jgi:hypothetical protein
MISIAAFLKKIVADVKCGTVARQTSSAHHFRISDERNRDRQTPLHSTGEGPGPLVRRLGETHFLDALVGLRHDRVRLEPLDSAEQHQVLLCRQIVPEDVKLQHTSTRLGQSGATLDRIIITSGQTQKSSKSHLWAHAHKLPDPGHTAGVRHGLAVYKPAQGRDHLRLCSSKYQNITSNEYWIRETESTLDI